MINRSFEPISPVYRRKIDIVNFKKGIIFDLAVVLICCLSFWMSWIESSLNLDAHHWGLMYGQALDIKKALIPYKETLPLYGYFTSWIQSIALTLLGERLISIGIATGFFYSLNFFISYKIFLKFLPKYLAYFSVFIMFLLHGHIIYPWSNYYSYTFLLLAVLFLINDKKSAKNCLLSGLFLGLSLLSRYTALPALLPPFILFFIYKIVWSPGSKKKQVLEALWFILGFGIIFSLFFIYLLYNNVNLVNDFWYKIDVISQAWTSHVTFSSLVGRLLVSILTFKTIPSQDSRSFFFTLNFFVNLSCLIYCLFKSIFINKKLEKNENILILVCLVTLFGYFNSIHLYEVFRLINGTSLGIGIIGYILMITVSKFLNNSKAKVMILIPLIIISFIWGNSAILKSTSSAYVVWNLDVLTSQGIKDSEISLFKGKALDKTWYNFYNEVFQILKKFDPSYYLFNYTLDTIVTSITDLPRVHLLPTYIVPEIEEKFKESEKVQHIINSQKAIILTPQNFEKAGYRMIFNKPWPFGGFFNGANLHISIPEEAYLKFFKTSKK